MSTLANELKVAPQKSGMSHAAWRAVSRWPMTNRLVWDSPRQGTYKAGKNAAKRTKRLFAKIDSQYVRTRQSED